MLVAAAVVLIALGATATLFLLRGANDDIPVVSDIRAQSSDRSITFTWDDPGLRDGDTYQITTTGRDPIIQRTPSYQVNAEPGERVCITVAVNRDAKTGPPSAEKCDAVAQ